MEVLINHDHICRARYDKPLLFMLAGWLMLLAHQTQAVTLNVTNYGAIGDCANITVSVTSNSSVVVTTNRFSTADVGKVMELFQAGYYAVLTNSGGIFGGNYHATPTNHQDMVVTILSVANGTNVTISSACGVTTNNILCTYGTQNMMAFSNCIAAAPTNPTTIYIPTGNYLLIPPTALDTNFIQSSEFSSYPTITIRRGGLHFLGDGTNLTILTGNGAWQQKGLDCAYRGWLFNILSPITNDSGPLIFDSMQISGNATSNHSTNYMSWPAIPTDGSGWDVTHHCIIETGTGACNAYKVVTNCLICHWHGETLQGLYATVTGATDTVANCTFYDGNATALNWSLTLDIHDNVFQNYYEVMECYLVASNTCYFQHNLITNIYGGGIAMCGAVTNRQMPTFNFISNIFYLNTWCIGITPAQNINIIGNYFSQGNVVLGLAGYQGTAINSNIFIAFNTFTNSSGNPVYVEGGQQNSVANVTVVSNSAAATVNSYFADSYGWSTNVVFLNNSVSGSMQGLFNEGASGQWFIDDLSNQFPPYKQSDGTGKTNTISYASGGIRHQISANAASSVWVLDDTHPSQVPPGAILQIISAGSYPAPLYSSVSMSGTPIALTNGETANYLWTNGAWVNMTGVGGPPPANPTNQVSVTALPFGIVLNGTIVTGSFTVKNIGGGTLSGSASVAAPFSIVLGGTYNLTANQSQTVTVSFNPTTAGSYSQNVTLTGGGGASVGVSGSATNAPVPTPVLQVTPGSIAYGTILNGTSKTNSFTVQNIGTGTLTGTASVGAPFSIVSGGTYSLGAGASQPVTVVFSPTGATNYSQSVTFTGGNGTNTTVTGSATNAPVPTSVLQVTPGSIAYGTILNGTSKTNSFTVQNIGTGTLTGTANVGAPFSIVSGGSYSLGAGASQPVTVVFSPTGATNYSQSVTFTGGNGTNTTVTGSATNAPVPTPVLQVTPGSIAYGTILNGTSKTNSFTVQNIGTGTLTGTASVGAPFSIVSGGSYSLGASASQIVTVVFSPTVASNFNQSVTFTGGSETNTTVTGSATNAPVPTPVLQVTPGSIAYGTILNGTSKTNNFTVQNIGTGTLTGTASVSAPFGVVSGGTYSLGASASQTVTVIFSPTVASNFNQSVTFTGGTGTNTTVTGSATNAPPILPTVSAINVNATDVDLSLPGLQIYAGTTVQFSAQATNAQTWQWSYAINGGTPVVWTNGTSPITNISGYFDTNTISNSYVWTLVVSNSQGWAESQTNLTVEAQPLGTTNTGLIFTATNGVLSGMLMGDTGINGVSSSYIFMPSPAPGDISSGTAVYNFTIATAGNYEIQALVDAPNTSANSFAVNMDAPPQEPAMIWDILPITSGFQQRIVSWRGSGTASSDQFVPEVFGLSAGPHQIHFKGEGPGTALASFTLLQVIPAAPAAALRSIQSSPSQPPTTPDGLRIISPGP